MCYVGTQVYKYPDNMYIVKQLDKCNSIGKGCSIFRIRPHDDDIWAKQRNDSPLDLINEQILKSKAS